MPGRIDRDLIIDNPNNFMNLHRPEIPHIIIDQLQPEDRTQVEQPHTLQQHTLQQHTVHQLIEYNLDGYNLDDTERNDLDILMMIYFYNSLVQMANENQSNRNVQNFENDRIEFPRSNSSNVSATQNIPSYINNNLPRYITENTTYGDLLIGYCGFHSYGKYIVCLILVLIVLGFIIYDLIYNIVDISNYDISFLQVVSKILVDI